MFYKKTNKLNMKQTAVEWLFQNIWLNPPENLLEILDQAKEIEKQQQGYSDEDLKYAFDSGRVRLTFDKERPFVFKNYEEFIEQFKNK